MWSPDDSTSPASSDTRNPSPVFSTPSTVVAKRRLTPACAISAFSRSTTWVADRAIDWVRDGYARIVQRLIRVALVSLLAVALIGGGIFGLARITPTSFLPEEDQGAFFLNIQLPEGASVSRTSETARQIEALLKTMPQVQDVFAVMVQKLPEFTYDRERSFRHRSRPSIRGSRMSSTARSGSRWRNAFHASAPSP